MRCKIILALLCLPLLAVQIRTAPLPHSRSNLRANPPQIAMPMSTKVLYEALFNRMAHRESLANKRESDGEDATTIRYKFYDDLQLSRPEADILRSFAFDCLAQTEELDKQAAQIIKEARARFPGGKLNGQRLPECPEILRIMQKQRDDIFLNARLLLISAFGASRYEAFEGQLRYMLQKNLQSR